MGFPQNDYPNFANFPEASFPQEVTPPSVDPDVDMLCVRYNPAWAIVLMAACSQLTQLSSWKGTDDEKKLAVNRATNLKIQLQKFEECDMGCCTEVIIHRINPDTGRMEISTDDGATWTPDPDDPANLVIQLPAPVPAGVSSTKCDAATNGWEHINDIIDHDSSTLGAGGSVFEIGTAIALFIIATIISGGTALAFAGMILGVVGALVTLGQAAFDAYWGVDERAKILCALYCNINPDGSFDGAGYDNFLAALESELTAGVPKTMLIKELQSMGMAGLNNLCAYGVAADSDCSACDCEDCLTGWVIENDPSSGAPAAITSEISDPDDPALSWITATAELRSDGHYYAIMHRTGTLACCSWVQREFVSGTEDDHRDARVMCGDADPNNFISGFSTGDCVQRVLVRNNSAFTVKFIFTACP